MEEEKDNIDVEKTNFDLSVIKTEESITNNLEENTKNLDNVENTEFTENDKNIEKTNNETKLIELNKELKYENNTIPSEKIDLKETIEETYLDCNLLYKEPNYAEICSFFNMFSSLLNMKPISFIKLEKNFCTLYNGNDSELIDIHITLMRKIYLKYARADNFDSVLEKFCNICPALESEAIQLQRLSYGNLPLSIRLSILKALCESQFDCNIKFKENIFNTYQTYDLRLAPIGRDKNGFSYYYQQDCDLNIRVYIVEPDDLSGGTWALKAKSEKELLILIHKLKSPDFVRKIDLKNEDEEIDEDQLLDDNNKLKENKTKEEVINATLEEDFSIIEMTEIEMNNIVTTNKRFTFWDLYRDASCIDKKKLAKESKKKQKEHCKATTSTNVEVEIEKPKIETDEEPETLNTSDRRIMPRRGARNSAINNIKAFTLSKSKNISSKKELVSADKTKGKTQYDDLYIKAGTSNESDFSEDENDEEIDSVHSSDDEFTLSETKTQTKTLTKNNKKQRKRKSRQISKNSVTNLTPRNKKSKQIVMNYVDEESSEDEEEEELKERRKATEETLCMDCRSSKRPDLLLLCDMCDDAWHTWCLRPKLWYVPDGDWFCPNCEHKTLIQKLSFALIKLREALKMKEAETKKKQAAADRLKREIDFIGISLNNIIPSNVSLKNDVFSSSSVEDDGIRKSKKRAMKKVLSTKNRNNSDLNYCSSIVTIAEGRSRRRLTKVDYNFHAYDEQLQEAMKLSDSTKVKDKLNDDLIQTENNVITESTVDGTNDNILSVERLTGTKPLAHKLSKKARRSSKKKLTDLEVDDAVLSSETDEYHESNDGEQTEDAEPSEEEYLPSEFRRTRNSRRYKRTLSDDEFIDDNDSSDYEVSLKRKGRGNRKNNFGRRRRRGKGRGFKRARNYSESEEESSEEVSEKFCSESSDENDTKRKRPVSKSKWGPKASTSELDEDELEIPEELSCDEKTETGRPLRKAAVEMQKKMKDIENNFAKDDEFESDSEQENDQDLLHDQNLQNKQQNLIKKKKPFENDEDSEVEFQLDDEEEEDDEESITEQEKEDDFIKEKDEGKKKDIEINEIINETNYSSIDPKLIKVNKILPIEEKLLDSIHTLDNTKSLNWPLKQSNILASSSVNNYLDQKQSDVLLINSAENSKEFLKTTTLSDTSKNNLSLMEDLLIKPKRRGRGPGKKRFMNASTLSKSSVPTTVNCDTIQTPSTSHQIVKKFSTQLSTPTVHTELRLLSQTMPTLNQQQTVMVSQLAPVPLPSTLPISGSANSSQPSIIHLKQVQTPSSISNPIHLQRSLQSNQVQHLSYSAPQYYRISTQPNLDRDETSSQQYLSVQTPENIPASSQFASNHYVQQPHYVPPQYVYQSIQPYGLTVAGPTPPQQMIVDPRTGQIIDQDSLGHALAGAMNPEDL